jgi:hypothetical protein
MITFRFSPPEPALTPCVGVCEMDSEGLCLGCKRTRDEIARWSQIDNTERARIMRDVLPTRHGRH